MTTRALVTNDDGIASEGLRRLALAAVSLGFDVVVAAPSTEASGSSAALTAVQSEGRIVVEQRTLEGLEAVEAHAVAAAPGFIVLIALRGAFGRPPDLVLSGINRGANLGNVILHSGTVGATLTAAAEGCSGLAVSLASGRPVHWDTAAEVAGPVIESLVAAPRPLVLNLNVPDVDRSELRGVRRARLARFGHVQTTLTEVGRGYVKLGVEESGAPLEPGSDVALVADGYATLTPLNPICERLDVALPAVAAGNLAQPIRNRSAS
jgi:5'-nucleotidase